MDFLFTLAIFIVILFLYIYIVNQYKKSEDLDIYETDFSDNTQLQEVCDIRQPIIFQFQNIHPKLFAEMEPSKISKYHSHDVRVKDAHDYYNHNRAEHTQVDSVNMSFNSTIKLLENDTASHFFSEDNEEFLEDSGLLKSMKSIDDFLKPNFTVFSNYDLMFGSMNAVTPLRYHTNYRKFICVTSGSIRIKMAPWKCSKYLHPIKDYENYEFRSPVHPISPKPEYAMDFEKTKFLEFDVKDGYVLYIPPYWWYSIQYSHVPGTFVCEMNYNTVMNCISNIPDLGLYWLQQQNITKKITKISETVPISHQPILEHKEIIDQECTEHSSINSQDHFPLPPSNTPISEEESPIICDYVQDNTSVISNNTLSENNEISKMIEHDTLAKSIANETIDNVIRKISASDTIVQNI
jgi:hypothetical protein